MKPLLLRTSPITLHKWSEKGFYETTIIKDKNETKIDFYFIFSIY